MLALINDILDLRVPAVPELKTEEFNLTALEYWQMVAEPCFRWQKQPALKRLM